MVEVGILPFTWTSELRPAAITIQVENGWLPQRIADWAGTSELMITRYYRHKVVQVREIGPIESRTQRREGRR